MKRVKISVVITLLLITLSLTLLSGCSVNLEKINEKNAEAIEFGFYAQTIEEYLQDFDGETRKEYEKGFEKCDYIIHFRASEEIRTKYDYILISINQKIDIEWINGEVAEVFEKNKLYVYPNKIYSEYISLASVGKRRTNSLAFAFLTQEQLDEITFGEIEVAMSYTEEVWNKALQVSDKIIEWNL